MKTLAPPLHPTGPPSKPHPPPPTSANLFASLMCVSVCVLRSEGVTEMELAAEKKKRPKKGPGGGDFRPKRNVRKGKVRKR